MTPHREEGTYIEDLIDRIDQATDVLLESMAIFDAEEMRRRVCDAFYLLLEGQERAAAG